ncbi:hypothetical protein WJX81_006606 [Elliptochloris bilobata]|uniref:RRM domain-containing protein n=1 Tax=Elliptochloris bilobata TaxID=381761 RepID=A0AAW1S8F4_9CHLO
MHIPGVFHLTEAHVFVVMTTQGRSSGQAFVEFPSPGDADHAMQLDRQMFGNRYVELFLSSPEEMQRATGGGYY